MLTPRIQERPIPYNDSLVCDSIVKITESGMPLSQKINFNFGPSNANYTNGQFSIEFDFSKKSQKRTNINNDVSVLEQLEGNGKIRLFKNDKKISFFDINDSDFFKIVKYFPKLASENAENVDLSKRFLSVDLFNAGRQAMLMKGTLEDMFTQKGYPSAGIASLNYCLAKGINCDSNDQFSRQIQSSLCKGFGATWNRNTEQLQYLSGVYGDNHLPAKSNQDLLMLYLLQKQRTYYKRRYDLPPMHLAIVLIWAAIYKSLIPFADDKMVSLIAICGSIGSCLAYNGLNNQICAWNANRLISHLQHASNQGQEKE